MDNIYVYFVNMPPNVHEMVTPCLDGFTIYLDIKEDEKTTQKRLIHALKHIDNSDFENENVQIIESEAHNGYED